MGKLAARIVLWADSSCCLEVFLYIYYNFFFFLICLHVPYVLHSKLLLFCLYPPGTHRLFSCFVLSITKSSETVLL